MRAAQGRALGLETDAHNIERGDEEGGKETAGDGGEHLLGCGDVPIVGFATGLVHGYRRIRTVVGMVFELLLQFTRWSMAKWKRNYVI